MASATADAANVPPSLSSTTIPSSQLSFRTAKSMPSCSSPPEPDTLQIEYRPAAILPYELQEHCAIYFEERLCTYSPLAASLCLTHLPDCQALHFLISLLTAGAASPIPRPVLIPPPQFLRLVSTMAVHPTLTNRAKSADRRQAANLAHRYLRLVLKHAGPVQSDMREAFKYAGVGSRGTVRRRTAETLPERDQVDAIENDLANSAALFAQAETFWQVVGWVFNCSVLHNRRWERWRSWLEYMIEVLEIDWEIRHGENQVEQSMLVQYIIVGGGQIDSGRKILRAIFADGRKTSVGEFKEIWQNETKELRKVDHIRKAEKLINIEADNYGDYVSDEDDADLEEAFLHSMPSSRSNSPRKKATQPPQEAEILNAAERFGGTFSLYLRFRLLSLLSTVAHEHSSALGWSTQQVTGGVERLYDQLIERLRPLDLPTFFLFMSPSTLRPFGAAAASVLTQYLLHRSSLIEGDAPEPASYELTEESLLDCHIPWAASNNSVTDNAKVSLCVETLIRLYDRYGGGLTWTQELEDMAERGIKRREDKASEMRAKRGRKRKGDNLAPDNREEWTFLMESAARIRHFLQVVKQCNFPSQNNSIECG